MSDPDSTPGPWEDRELWGETEHFRPPSTPGPRLVGRTGVPGRLDVTPRAESQLGKGRNRGDMENSSGSMGKRGRPETLRGDDDREGEQEREVMGESRSTETPRTGWGWGSSYLTFPFPVCSSSRGIKMESVEFVAGGGGDRHPHSQGTPPCPGELTPIETQSPYTTPSSRKILPL